MLAAAKSHPRSAALLILAAACLVAGVAVKAATVPGARASARTLAAQQLQIEQNPLPADLAPVQLSEAPGTVRGLFSLSHWPFWPPLPPGCSSEYPGSDFYFSASLNALFVDDRQNEVLAMAAEASIPPLPDGTNSFGTGEGSGTDFGPLIDPNDHTNLYLIILSATNGMVQLVLHNTSNAVPYEVISSVSLTNRLTNWTSEGIWVGSSTNTPANVAIGLRTNRLFFRAHAWGGQFDHGVPTNGQLFLQANTNLIYVVTNGVTTNLTAFYSNWFMLNPPLYQVNLGYGANDAGFTNAWIQPFPAQGIKKLVGFSTTCSNLCLCTNPIESSLDVSGWPALQDLECWQCASGGGLYHVNVTNCPNLVRVCVESCGLWWSMDFTGCPKIADIRGASNANMHGVVIPSDCKSAVWHLCIHDDTGFDDKGSDLTGFPAMRQLWAWNDGFTHPLNYPALGTPTKLESVQAYRNAIGYADFSGQTNLQLLEIYDGQALTNLNMSGCSSLGLVKLYNEKLSQGAVDHVLTNLVLTGITSTNYLTNTAGVQFTAYVHIEQNSAPSSNGLAAITMLKDRGWTVYYDEPPVVPNTNCVTGTAAIWFTNTSSTVRMQVQVSTNYNAVTWYLGDGTKICGSFDINVAVLPGSSNAVVVDPPSALLAFGVSGPNCVAGTGSQLTKLSSVWGLTNYPNLQQLYLYGTDLSYVSLAKCTNLTAIALTGTSPASTNVISDWFTDLLAAQTNTTIANVKWFGCDYTDAKYFYYPATPGFNTNAANALVPLHDPIGWNFWHPTP